MAKNLVYDYREGNTVNSQFDLLLYDSIKNQIRLLRFLHGKNKK